MRLRRNIRRLLCALLILLVVIVAGGLLFFLFLEKYMVYSPDGARLEFPLNGGAPGSVEDSAPPSRLVIESPSGTAEIEKGLRALFVPVSSLSAQTDLTRLPGLEGCNAVVLQLRAGSGDMTWVSRSRLSRLKDAGYSVYLQISCFADNAYALENPSAALSLPDGALMRDEAGNRWLDPASSDGSAHISALLTRLAELDIDGVVLADFEYPPQSVNGRSAYSYDPEADRSAILLSALEAFHAALDGSGVGLCLRGSASLAEGDSALPSEAFSRLVDKFFIESATPSKADSTARALGLPAGRIVSVNGSAGSGYGELILPEDVRGGEAEPAGPGPVPSADETPPAAA